MSWNESVWAWYLFFLWLLIFVVFGLFLMEIRYYLMKIQREIEKLRERCEAGK